MAYLGRTLTRQGRHAEALSCYEESLEIFLEQDDRYGQADSLLGLGESLVALGRREPARPHLQRALTIFEELRSPEARSVRELLAAGK